MNLTMSCQNFKIPYQLMAFQVFLNFCCSSNIRTHLKICYTGFGQALDQQCDSFIVPLLVSPVCFLPWGNVLDKIRNGSEVCCFFVEKGSCEIMKKELADHSTFLGKLGFL